LLSVAQRKQVIGELYKKDKKTGQILLRESDELLYEKPGEKLRKNIEFFFIAQIESIDKNYSDIYLKQILFGPFRESFAPGATLETHPITKRYESVKLMHITYNKDLDMFNITTGIGDNTYNSFGQFNHSKKVFIDSWENEDARSLTNAFVGRGGHINTTSDKLPKDILKKVTENTFDELYKQVWDNNHKVITPESIIFEGKYEDRLELLESAVFPSDTTDEIPDLEGSWTYKVTVFRRNSESEVPDLNNLVIAETQAVIKQKNEFLYLELPSDSTRPVPGFLLGIVNKESSKTRLDLVDFDDNGIFALTDTITDSNGNIVEFKGTYREPGFVGTPLQLQTIGKVSLTKIVTEKETKKIE
jgi:hypothetical protein